MAGRSKPAARVRGAESGPVGGAALGGDDGHVVTGPWADWSPGYRPSPEEIDPVKDVFADPAVVTAALAYYRHPLNPALRAPDLADAQQAVMGGRITFCDVAPRIDVVDACGHFAHRERPDEVDARMLDFLGDPA
ncbi:hypothetical protein [Nonomuraea zeae]|uniref:Alpha/beta hydrolase n=1 Tax=Nonomuraea zeae TaxID=1642303 RepID=A0A5S4H2Q9_9ACTN|nr:hypothetical protein [Nonomuraea zeae]TMR33090.1 hypothetical protein ETD85_21025 [Nonomuraea zeae]